MSVPASAVPNVVVSVAPIHSLMAGVMHGIGKPVLVFNSGVSPHTNSISPSAIKSLVHADLVVWVGPGYETAMNKTIAQLEENILIKALIAEENLTVHNIRQGGQWERHDHGSVEEIPEADLDQAISDVDLEQHLYSDPHLWLSTSNGLMMIDFFQQWLSELDPVNKSKYSKNAIDMKNRVKDFQSIATGQLESVHSQPYLVYHDAYQYFEKEFDMNAVGSVSTNPQQPPGAKRIHELRQLIVDQKIKCIFREPQFESRIIEVLSEGNDIKTGKLDPLGIDIAPGDGLWFKLMTQLSNTIKDCL